MKEKKEYLIEAIGRKAHANMGKEDDKDFNDNLKQLSKWVDIEKDKKYAALVLKRHENAKQYGLMLKLLNSLLEKNGEDTKDGIAPMTKDEIREKRIEVLKILDFSNLVKRDESWSQISNATKDFALF